MEAVRDRLDGMGALGPARGKARPSPVPATIPRADRAADDSAAGVTVAKGWGERPARRRG